MPQPSIQSSVSPLRQRMLEDMAMRGLREETQRDYIRFVRSFAAFLRRSPDTATAEDVRRFQVHQSESGMQPPSINSSVSALRFFFNVTLDRPDLSRRLVLVRHPRKLPNVLSVEEVGRLLEAAPGPKYRAALGTAYGAGLRVSEVTALKGCDVDSTRMLIRVEQGKGRKDRNAMLSPQLLDLLRLWWREGKRRTEPCCRDQQDERRKPSPVWVQAVRTEIGRPSSNIRFRAWTATSTSVARRWSVRERNPSPITCLNLPMAASTRARML